MHESLSNQPWLPTPVLRCRQGAMPRIASFLCLVLARTSSTDYSGIQAPVYQAGASAGGSLTFSGEWDDIMEYKSFHGISRISQNKRHSVDGGTI